MCPSGRRYGDLAGAGLANECVVPGEGTESSTATSGVDSASSSSSSSSSSSTGEGTSGSGDSGSDETGDAPSVMDFCPPLPATSEDEFVVEVGVDDLDTLQEQLDRAAAGTTFLLEDGTYEVPDGIRLRTPGITLRSASGDPQAVVLQNSVGSNAVVRIEASDVTVGELTAQYGGSYNVFVTSNVPEPITGTLLYRLVLRDAGNYQVRMNYGSAPVDDGTIACSTIELTNEARTGGSCDIIGGISGRGVAGWDVRDNVVQGFYCDEGTGEPAITFSSTSYDNIVQRNIVRESAVGIRFGNHQTNSDVRRPPSHDCEPGYYGHIGGVIRNNMVSAAGTGIATSGLGFDSGILAWQVCGVVVSHNTVAAAQSHNSIEYRYERTEVSVLNNLVSGEIVLRDGASAPVIGNIEGADLNVFVAPLDGDLHLVPDAPAVDAGVNLGANEVPYDIDGEARTGPLDVGADEVVEP